MTAGRFLNVDLDIESATDLSPLVNELEPKSVILHSGPMEGGHILCLEPAISEGLEETLHDLCRLVEELSPEGRLLWQAARRREFNVGLDGQPGHIAVAFSINLEALQRVVRLGANLGITVYSPEENTEGLS